MRTAIWWVRRDLRLSDNSALAQALAAAEEVVPVFILDPVLLTSRFASAARSAFLFRGLEALDLALRRRGSYLLIRRGRPLEVLAGLVGEVGAGLISSEADVSPYARHRDGEIGRDLPLTLTPGITVHQPGAVSKANGSPYTVFTPFKRAWQALPLPERGTLPVALGEIVTPAGLGGENVPASTSPLASTFPSGEKEARRRLNDFTAAQIFSYDEQRNRMDLAGTSALSPYLRFGMISLRQAVIAAREAVTAASNEAGRAGAESWLNELIWREFYLHILYHFPQVRSRSFRAKMERFPWRNNDTDFKAWCQGQTGYPVVDAAMRQLAASGWMHNRARMIVASFLTKHLLIRWQRGEAWFMQQLVDGDPAANNGGWQWAAGTGTDAAPYFRIFNPIIQGEKFDPAGDYVRRWVPELERVPDKYVHRPWEMARDVQEQSRCLIGRDYPAPIVDHAFARGRALDALAQTKT